MIDDPEKTANRIFAKYGDIAEEAGKTYAVAVLTILWLSVFGIVPAEPIGIGLVADILILSAGALAATVALVVIGGIAVARYLSWRYSHWNGLNEEWRADA